MPLVKSLTNSHRHVINNPKIIKSKISYNYENYINIPNIVYIIENKLIDNELLNYISTKSDDLSFRIDYDELDTSKSNNIFNLFNNMHSDYIKSIDEQNIGKYKNDYYTNNYNFAYHYFIDKKGNIYEGRPHSLKAYNLDIYKYLEDKKDVTLINQGDLIFDNALIILTEEQTNDIDTTNETYAALNSLLIYLKQEYNYDKFYSYSELNTIPYNQYTIDKDLIKYNNPGLFFKINELHSSVEKKSLKLFNENNNTFTYGERVLRYQKPKYMSGNDILMTQKMLINLKLLTNKQNLTGTYNLETKNAIEKFQKKYYITPSIDYGIADKETLNQLRDQIYNSKIENVKLIDDNYKPYRVLEYIDGNLMCGKDIILIQNRLKKCIYPILKVNGIFDKYTEDAIKMFQSKYDIFMNNKMIDGKVGPFTWKQIINCKDKIYIDKSDSVIEGAITPTKNTVSKNNIIYLQKAINKLLADYGVELELTGVYDKDTQKYIKLINENENNRKIMGLDKYTDKEGNELDWTNDIILSTCYPIEFVWLIKHYLLNENIELDLFY